MTKPKRPTKVEKADIKVARAAAPVRTHPLMRIAGDLSDMADQPPLRAIAAATIAAGAIGRDRRLTLVGMRMLLAHQLATSVKSVIKQAVDRTRPEVMLEGGEYRRGKGRHEESRWNSFPSGHTAGAIAVARAIGRDYPGGAIPALGVATVLAAVQVPRGKHYVSDVVVGAVIGVVAEAGLTALARRLRR
ncbi:MAG: phosphatase PAP2 family protein [Pseudomonadota bacterium]|jgi:membrane-associated phospholipid phosphatase|nr:phosphatase PAP2 family protein [Pseudomonadota bacterium]